MSKFGRQHYNAIAKDIRETFPLNGKGQNDFLYRKQRMAQRTILSVLMLKLARRFQEDNEEFDPLVFLDQCSPNTELYPLSELWED